MRKIHLLRIKTKVSTLIGFQNDNDPLLDDLISTLPGIHWNTEYDLMCIAERPHTVKELLSTFRDKVWLDLSHLRTFPHGTTDIHYHVIKGRILNQDKHEALEKVMRELRVKRYSKSTLTNYRSVLELFLKYFNNVDLNALNNDDIIEFNEIMILNRGQSASTQRQFTGAIKHFFSRMLNTEVDVTQLEYARKNKHLPIVLSQEEMASILKVTHNDKHRVILLVLYAQGLRISELLSLKVSDIDLQRKKIHLRHTKGRRDRSLPLSEVLEKVLRQYLASYRPQTFLISGQTGGMYSSTSVNKMIKTVARKAGIMKKVTAHTLRHSYATHCLELGLGLRYIQEFLGHRNPKTTMIYTHIRNDKQHVNPLDELTKGMMGEDRYQDMLHKGAHIPPNRLDKQ